MPSKKEDKRLYDIKYRAKNKEKKRLQDKEWREKNKEYMKKYIKSYRPKNLHSYTISQWKFQGIKLRPNEDWDSVYLYWKTCERCELCDVELTDGRGELTSRNLDHDHDTGFIRNVLCWGCNIKRR